MPTHYNRLGVQPDADRDTIWRAYLSAVRHALSSGDDAHSELADLDTAWETLRHAVSRAAYDASIGVQPLAEPADETPRQEVMTLLSSLAETGHPPGDGFEEPSPSPEAEELDDADVAETPDRTEEPDEPGASDDPEPPGPAVLDADLDRPLVTAADARATLPRPGDAEADAQPGAGGAEEHLPDGADEAVETVRRRLDDAPYPTGQGRHRARGTRRMSRDRRRAARQDRRSRRSRRQGPPSQAASWDGSPQGLRRTRGVLGVALWIAICAGAGVAVGWIVNSSVGPPTAFTEGACVTLTPTEALPVGCDSADADAQVVTVTGTVGDCADAEDGWIEIADAHYGCLAPVESVEAEGSSSPPSSRVPAVRAQTSSSRRRLSR